MKLDSFITFAIDVAHNQNPEPQEIRFQVSVDMDMIVHSAKVTINGTLLPLEGIQIGAEPYGLDFSIRIAGRGSDAIEAR
jgi:hypothetical protein